jgi:hypothetical protein
MKRLILACFLVAFISPAYAADEPRKIDFTTVLADQDGEPMTECAGCGKSDKWIPVDDNGTTRYIPAW